MFHNEDPEIGRGRLSTGRPKYALGHSISLAALVLTLILTLLQIGYLNWENRKRDRGDWDARLFQEDAHRLGHRHPQFRYTC